MSQFWQAVSCNFFLHRNSFSFRNKLQFPGSNHIFWQSPKLSTLGLELYDSSQLQWEFTFFKVIISEIYMAWGLCWLSPFWFKISGFDVVTVNLFEAIYLYLNWVCVRIGFLKGFKNTKLKNYFCWSLSSPYDINCSTGDSSGLQKNFVWHWTELVKIQDMPCHGVIAIFTICEIQWFPV